MICSMSNIEHNTDPGLADFVAGWRKALEDNEWITDTYAVIGLTNFGERPAPSARLAEVLHRSVSDAETLARQWGWPGTQVANGLIFVNPERVTSAPRRKVQIGDRRFGVTGCGGRHLPLCALGPPINSGGGNLPDNRNANPARLHFQSRRACRTNWSRPAAERCAGA